MLLAAPALAQTEGLPVLHELALVSDGVGDLPLTEVQVSLQLHPTSAQRTSVLQRRDAVTAGPEDSTLVLRSAAYPGGSDAAKKSHLASTFVIDWKTPQVTALKDAVAKLKGADALRRFVAGYIRNKSLGRTYDVASVVAERQEGDCTEHAVLLCALARQKGLPARVVHGIVLLRFKGRLGAFGHAWVEVRTKRGWTVQDAALDGVEGALYLPLAVMEDEGPAHAIRLMSQTSPADVVRVVLTPKTQPASTATGPGAPGTGP